MPMGTSTKVTDSIINVIEKNAIIAGNELQEKYMKDDKRKLIQNIQKILEIMLIISRWSLV